MLLNFGVPDNNILLHFGVPDNQILLHLDVPNICSGFFWKGEAKQEPGQRFDDISVLATFQFWWYFSFGDISVLSKFHFKGHLGFGFELSVWAII